jgi:hypothetical protein
MKVSGSSYTGRKLENGAYGLTIHDGPGCRSPHRGHWQRECDVHLSGPMRHDQISEWQKRSMPHLDQSTASKSVDCQSYYDGWFAVAPNHARLDGGRDLLVVGDPGF